MAGDQQDSFELTGQHGLCYVDLSRTGFAPGASTLLPEEVARRERAVPIERRGRVTVVAVATPADDLTLDALRAGCGGEVVTVVAPAAQVTAALAQLYGDGASRHVRRRAQAGPSHLDRSMRARSRPLGSARAVRTDAGFVGGDPDAPSDAMPSTGGGWWSEPAEPQPAATSEAPGWPLAPAAPPPGAAVPSEPVGWPPAREGPAPSWPEAASLRPPAAAPPPGAPPAPAPMPGAWPTGAVARGEGGVADVPARVEFAAAGGPRSALAPQVAEGATADAGGLIAAAGGASWPTLARALVASGKVGVAEMARAVRDHDALGESLSQYLRREKLATEEDLVRAMAGEVGLEFVDLSAIVIDPVAVSLVPGQVARRHMVLPFRFDPDGTPVVAMANPTDVFAMDDLRSIIGRNFRAVVATREHLDFQLRRLLEPTADVQAAAQSAAGTMATDAASGFELESLHTVVDDAPIVRYVNLLILQALNERASDIHIEPTPRCLRVRFRIDGVMHDASSASPAIHASVISRLKVLGDMDITEHRVPQEGRVSVTVGDRQIDLRLAIVPSLYGETCVMRLLDKSASIRRLSELGFLSDTLARYAQAYNQPYGVILVTGPTGAGKTTTLYATLQEVMSEEKSVVTVEDPVEYQIPGITQVQINPKAGLQFSTALRSILRADPDIILVGEIRDIETASIAMEAALSGHLVLSTLHTNTAASTPLRLTEMGVEPFLVTSAVTGVMTQRLARVLCDRCKQPFEATPADYVAAGYGEADLAGLNGSVLYRATGCPTCSHTGYYGRMLLGEVMPVSEEIERMIIEQQSIVSIERMAVQQGMRTLRQDGLRKAIAGYTTLEEVLRVVV